MKESQLLKKMQAIQDTLEESQIVQKCYKAAKEHGKGNTETHDYHTTHLYNLKKGDLAIYVDDGWSMMGGGEIKVKYKGEQVLYGDRYALDKLENKFNPKVNGFCIMTYLAGPWEREVNKIINPPKEKAKPKKPKEPEVDENTLTKLKNQFSHLN